MLKAARFYGPGSIKIEEVSIPEVGPGELLVKVGVTLTCGTDVKTYRRGHPLAKPPLIIGHEFAGTIVKVGGGVKGFSEGMKIVASNTAPCNTCYYCGKRKPNLCENLGRAIIGFNWDGAYAEYVEVPSHIVQQNTYIIPDHVPFEEAAFLEPLACVVHGAEITGISIGDSVAIMGSGPIGLLHAQLAKMYGAAQVIVTDPHDNKLEIAKRIGADYTINIRKEDPLARVKELTEGRGADVVIESVGHPEAWEMAPQMARKGGTILLFGGCPSGTRASFDTGPIHYGELTLKGAFHHTPESVERSFRLIASRQLKLKELLTRRMKLEQVEEALQIVMRGEAIKIIIQS